MIFDNLQFLFESIEFFGTEMPFNMTVYHGLNKEMMFQRFTAHFNQPISTAKDDAAQKFAKGFGIILQLSRPNNVLIPKFIDARHFSAFPNEDEHLFYGQHILFQINDIMQAKTLKSNQIYITAMSIFQHLVMNRDINWDKVKDDTLNILIELINARTNNAYKSKLKINKFVIKLFDYFCCNKSMNWICIRNFEKVPLSLKSELFGLILWQNII